MFRVNGIQWIRPSPEDITVAAAIRVDGKSQGQEFCLEGRINNWKMSGSIETQRKCPVSSRTGSDVLVFISFSIYFHYLRKVHIICSRTLNSCACTHMRKLLCTWIWMKNLVAWRSLQIVEISSRMATLWCTTSPLTISAYSTQHHNARV